MVCVSLLAASLDVGHVRAGFARRLPAGVALPRARGGPSGQDGKNAARVPAGSPAPRASSRWSRPRLRWRRGVRSTEIREPAGDTGLVPPAAGAGPVEVHAGVTRRPLRQRSHRVPQNPEGPRALSIRLCVPPVACRPCPRVCPGTVGRSRRRYPLGPHQSRGKHSESEQVNSHAGTWEPPLPGPPPSRGVPRSAGAWGGTAPRTRGSSSRVAGGGRGAERERITHSVRCSYGERTPVVR